MIEYTTTGFFAGGCQVTSRLLEAMIVYVDSNLYDD